MRTLALIRIGGNGFGRRDDFVGHIEYEFIVSRDGGANELRAVEVCDLWAEVQKAWTGANAERLQGRVIP